jgi:hypothetical protein
VISGAWASYDYFMRYPNMSESYYAYDADKLDALATLNGLAAAGNTVYLAPLWSEHATFAFLRDTALIKALDSGETVVLPPVGQGAVYAFPAEKAPRAAELADLWPGIESTIVGDRYGKPLLAMVQVPVAELREWPSRYTPDAQPDAELPAYFSEAPTLLGLQQRNDRRELRLFWRAETPMLRNLTTFVHFIDRDGRRVAQVDKLPGNGSYLTPTWTPGERVIERYDTEFHDICSGEDPLTVIVGWYELAAAGARRPRVDAARQPLDGDSAVAGTVTFPITAYAPADVDLPPAVNTTVGDDLVLYGYQINAETVQPGDPFSVELYWQATAALNDVPVTLALQQGDQSLPLWQEVVAPATPWHEGEIICRRVHVTLPADLPLGNYSLELAADGENHVGFHTITVGAN